MAIEEAIALGVRYTKTAGELKPINAQAMSILMREFKVPVRLDVWRRMLDLMIMYMDGH